MDAQGTPITGPPPETAFVLVAQRGAVAYVGRSAGKVEAVEAPEREADFAWLREALRR